MKNRILFASMISMLVQTAGTVPIAMAQAQPATKTAAASTPAAKTPAAGTPAPAAKAPAAPAAATPAATPVPASSGPAATRPGGSRVENKALDPACEEALNKGIALFNKSKYQEALVELQKALEMAGNNTAVMNWVAAAEQRLGHFDKAAELLDKIVSMDPDYADAQNNLAYCWQQLQDYEKAETHFRKAVALKPDSIDFQFNLACVLQLQKKNEESIKVFEDVLKKDPKRTDCFLKIGDMALESGDIPKAEEFYNKAALALNKKDPAIMTKKALIEKAKGDKAKCKELLEQVLDLDPASYDANLQLGIIAFEEKDWAKCLDYLGKALERNPYDAAVHYWLGRYYFVLDSLKSSIQQFKDALKCDVVEHKFPDCQEWLDKAIAKQKTF